MPNSNEKKDKNSEVLKAIHNLADKITGIENRMDKENADEAREVTGMKVFGAESLYDAFYALSAPENFSCAKSQQAFVAKSDGFI